MVGQTGNGRPLHGKTIARMLNVTFAIVGRLPFLTEAGYVGEDVESILSVYFRPARITFGKGGTCIVFMMKL